MKKLRIKRDQWRPNLPSTQEVTDGGAATDNFSVSAQTNRKVRLRVLCASASACALPLYGEAWFADDSLSVPGGLRILRRCLCRQREASAMDRRPGSGHSCQCAERDVRIPV